MSCDLCYFTMYSKNCMANHSKSFCLRRVRCLKDNCGEIIYANGTLEDRKAKLAKHDCLSAKCSDCKLKVNPFDIHDCKMLKATAQKCHPSLMFLSLSYFYKYSTDKDCDILEQEPNYACLYYKNNEDRYDSIHFNSWHDFYVTNKTNHCAIDLKAAKPKKISNQYGKLTDKINFKSIFIPRFKDSKIVSDILDYLFNENPRSSYNTTCLVASRQDLLYLSKILALLEFLHIQLNSIGNGISCIYIKEREITFIDINSYTNLDFVDLKLKFAQENSVVFFPWTLSTGEGEYWDLNYHLTKDMFVNETYRSHIAVAKMHFFDSLNKGEIENYSFKENLSKYMEFNTYCNMMIANSFLKTFTALELKFQNCVKKHFADDEYTLFFPFTNLTSTYTAAIYQLCRFYYLNTFDLRVVRFEYSGVPTNNCSKPESEYVQYLHYKDNKVTHSFTNKPIPKFKGRGGGPDAHLMLTETEGRGYWMDGCWTHFHNVDSCRILRQHYKFKTLTKGEKNLIRIRNRKYRNEKKMQYFKVLKENPKLLKEQIIQNECNWIFLKKKDQDVRHFMKRVYKPHFVQTGRLIPREALRGGYVDSYSFSFEAKENPYCSFKNYDTRSMYPYLAKCNEFPVGPVERFYDVNSEDIQITNEKLCFNKREIFGLCQVRVLAPKKLHKPFLYCKPKGESNASYLTLCHECAKESQIRLNLEKKWFILHSQ